MVLSELLELKNNKIRLDAIKKNRENIVPFVGAGISKGCGLYTWGELLHIIACEYLTEEEIDTLESNGDYMKYADEIIKVSGNSDMIMKRIREIFAQSNICENEIPQLIVSSFSPMIVTTNYDNILEKASLHSRLGQLRPLLPCLVGQMNEAIQINERCLLKIHGSVEETQSFVFSTEQYKNFYGEKNNRKGKLIPKYLLKIFSSKKVLFLGCSLEKDYTLDILEECIENNKSISHYAIVPLPSDINEQVRRSRELTHLSIEPIYYPEGDFRAISLLINYLSNENNFIKSMKKVLDVIFNENSQFTEKHKSIFISLLNESFYYTANKYHQLLDLENFQMDFSSEIIEYLGKNRSQEDTLLKLCEKSFDCFSRCISIFYKNEVVKRFSSYLRERAIEENEIESFLEKKWSIERNIDNANSQPAVWIGELSNIEINEYASDLIKKLQYRNGMSFAMIKPYYDNAVSLLRLAKNRINFENRIKLLNCVGAFGPYFCDTKASIGYLEECIDIIKNNGSSDRVLMLFLSKCYANLAISRSLCDSEIKLIIEAAEQDVIIKKRYQETPVMLSRSLNFYATVLKEIEPFNAFDVYVEAEKMKANLIKQFPKKNEFVASWATTVFNIGLLAKDCELYEIAYGIINLANKYRFNTVDYQNRDYCSSLNVMAELELHLKSKQNIDWLISGIESRVNLPIGFSKTMAHTWYICALYYYQKSNYSVAIKYVYKALNESASKGALFDFRQYIRIKLLEGDIRYAKSKAKQAEIKEAKDIYIDVINSITDTYGFNNYFLISPYRHLLIILEDEDEKAVYYNKYINLVNQYKSSLNEMRNKMEEFLEYNKDPLV